MKIGVYQSYWGQIGGGQRYMGLAAQYLAESNDVEFVHHHKDFDRYAMEEGLDLDLTRVRFRYVPELTHGTGNGSNPFQRIAEERRRGAELSSPYDLFINNCDHIPVFCHARRGVLLTHFPTVTYEQFNGYESDEWPRRSLVSRAGRKMIHKLEWKNRFGTYDSFIVNSKYGQRWIRQRWGVNAEVLYPPLRQGLKPTQKEPLIITVGAFHATQHKRQDVLLEAFKALVDQGLGNWRFVMIGGSNGSDGARDYISRLRHSATGYPVEICVNIAGDELNAWFNRASLLWHAMGYGKDERKEPEAFEHFGMIVPEAMSTGCLPIVFNGGGLPEIVNHGRDGFLWNTPEELQSFTVGLINDEPLGKSMAWEAIKQSTTFSTEAFRTRLLRLIQPLRSAHAGIS
jgi:glycosyltransferase involved in cell wall biosynthesis